MTPPVKPPGGPRPPSSPVEPQDGSEAVAGAVRGFAEALTGARAAEGAPAPGASSGPSALGAVVEELRAGRIDARQAVELLVERALESPAAQALDPAGREALRAHLRATMVEDPALAAMAGDLERAR